MCAYMYIYAHVESCIYMCVYTCVYIGGNKCVYIGGNEWRRWIESGEWDISSRWGQDVGVRVPRHSWRQNWDVSAQLWCVIFPLVAHDMMSSYVWHDSFSWLVRMCDMRHDILMRVTWLIHRYDKFTWLIHVWHETWYISMCDATYSFVWHDEFLCVRWRLNMRDITYAYAWH